MSKKPDGTNGKKPSAKVSVYKTKSGKPQARHMEKQENKIMRNAMKNVQRGAARAKRRASGDYHPVNEAASLAQHPYGRFATGK